MKRKCPLLSVRNGFTITELLVVLAIVAILAAIVIPDISGAYLPIYRLKGACRTIFTDMQYARMNAASLNREFRITFSVGSESYLIESGDLSSSSTSWTAVGAMRDFDDSTNPYYTPGINVISISKNPVVFKPTGTMTATTITVSNANNDTKTITSSLAGRIKIQ